jgi:hypothetical protein
LLKKLVQTQHNAKENNITSYERENLNTLDYSKSSKAFLLDPKWESLAATNCSNALKREMSECEMARARRMGRNFCSITLAQRMVMK